MDKSPALWTRLRRKYRTYCWTSDVFSAFPIGQGQTNLSRDVCVLHPIVFTTVWSTPSPSPVWVGQLLPILLKSFSWYVPSRMNLDLYETGTSIAIVRNSTPSPSHSRVSPCPSSCVTQSLTCPCPCSPTYQTHISAPKRNRGWELSFSFQLHFQVHIRTPTHHSIKESWIPWGSRLKLNQIAERFPRDWSSSWQLSFSVHAFGIIPFTTALKFLRSSDASFTFLSLSDADFLPSTPNVTTICPTQWRCWTIEVQSCPLPFSGSLLPHCQCPLIGSILECHVVCPLEPDAFHVLLSTVCSLCDQFISTKCSSLTTFVAHLCETVIQVFDELCLSLLWHHFQRCTTLNICRVSLCVYDAFDRSHWTGHSALHQ